MSTEQIWVVAVVTFGRVERTSTLGHLARPEARTRTLCGVELAAAIPAPESFIRCQRCIDARPTR